MTRGLLNCLLICFLLLPTLIWAQPRLQPLPPDGSFSAAGHIAYLTDSTTTQTVSDVWQQTEQFQPVRTRIIQFNKGTPPTWLRFRIQNLTTRPQPLVLEVAHTFIDELTCYTLDQTGTVRTAYGPVGWQTPQNRRTWQHRHPLVRFTLPPASWRWVYLRTVVRNSTYTLPVRLHLEEAFWQVDQQENLFWGVSFGLFGTFALFSLIFGVLLRDRLYVSYSFYVLAFGLFVSSTAGFWLVWIDRADYGFCTAQNLNFITNAFSILGGLFFVRDYVFRMVWHKRFIRISFYAGIISISLFLTVVLLAKQLTGFYERNLPITAPLVTSCFLMATFAPLLAVGWVAFTRSVVPGATRQSARFYLLSQLPLALYTVIAILSQYNLIEYYPVIWLKGAAISIGLEFIILTISLGIRYKRVVDERRVLAEETLIQQQKATQTELQLQQQQNQALQAQLKLQQEKERIARDLHDNVGAQLSVIASSLDYVRMTHPFNGSATRLEDIGTYAREAIGSLRETIWAINREQITLDEYRLQLQQYLHRQQTLIPTSCFRLQADLSDPHSSRPAPVVWLSSEQALGLFRITQEAVQNAVKHARASQITVRIDTHADFMLHLSVEDDGVGFDTAAEHPGHYGMLNMQLRAERLGGQWSVTSAPGRGTTLSLKLISRNTEV